VNEEIQYLLNIWKGSQPLPKDLRAAVMQRFRIDWNFHSNSMEGNTLSYGETRALLLYGITAGEKPLKDHIEMTGHNEALKWIIDLVNEERPLTENFIRQVHELILKDSYSAAAVTEEGVPSRIVVEVGQYKRKPNHVRPPSGEIFRFASPEETPALMMDLIAWYKKKKNQKDYDVVALATEFHYKFIRIHPFDDGNGRTARIMMNFILMSAGYPPVIIRTEDKKNYLLALRSADSGNFVAFLTYIKKSLLESLKLVVDAVKNNALPRVENDFMDGVDKAFIQDDLMVRDSLGPYSASLNIKQLKKLLGITDNDIAHWLQYKTDKAYRQSTAKPRIENFILEFYKKVKST